MYSVGNQIGVGKESGLSTCFYFPVLEGINVRIDVYIVADMEGNEMVLKIHRCVLSHFRVFNYLISRIVLVEFLSGPLKTSAIIWERESRLRGCTCQDSLLRKSGPLCRSVGAVSSNLTVI